MLVVFQEANLCFCFYKSLLTNYNTLYIIIILANEQLLKSM